VIFGHHQGLASRQFNGVIHLKDDFSITVSDILETLPESVQIITLLSWGLHLSASVTSACEKYSAGKLQPIVVIARKIDVVLGDFSQFIKDVVGIQKLDTDSVLSVIASCKRHRVSGRARMPKINRKRSCR
jgi:hypothetical protein